MPDPATTSRSSLRVWIDAQLPPALATWLSADHGIEATHVGDLGLLTATDERIFSAARAADAVVATKDIDFVQLLERRGPPPRVLWVTCGNVSNVALRTLFATAWPKAAALFAAGEPLVELGNAR
jgi:predicted nuclease of predicted toxin-antitoxin system